MILAVHLMIASITGCPPLNGVHRLWEQPNVRYVLVGEMHGTVETPEMFGDLVCNAVASKRPIVVALEAPDAAQGDIDDFLNSDGERAAQDRFKASIIWTNPFKDGRSSIAYFELFKCLRDMTGRGFIKGVVAFQPSGSNNAARSESEYNALMAGELRTAAAKYPDTLVVALLGNVHARKLPLRLGSKLIVPAGANLPADQTISLNVPVKGFAWNCSPECGPHEQEGATPQARGVFLRPHRHSAYDGEIGLGGPTTASPPVVAAAANQP